MILMIFANQDCKLTSALLKNVISFPRRPFLLYESPILILAVIEHDLCGVEIRILLYF